MKQLCSFVKTVFIILIVTISARIGATPPKLLKVKFLSTARITMIKTGNNSTYALKSDGSVWAWGLNTFGRIGDGTTTNRLTPVRLSTLAGIIYLDASNHALAVQSNGTVHAWGLNNSGQLGDGSNTDRSTPVQILGLSDVIAVAAGGSHSLALKRDGTVWAWGRNEGGQLGDGTRVIRNTPVQVVDLTSVTAIATGDKFSLAIKQDGSVWSWGSGANWLGANTEGHYHDDTHPARVAGLEGITAIAAGAQHTLALKRDGTVWSWGLNPNSALGNGTAAAFCFEPKVVLNLSGVSAIFAGGNSSMAIKTDGTLWAWGNNATSQLGNGTQVDQSSPIQVMQQRPEKTLTHVTPLKPLENIAAAALSSHVLALGKDGTLWTWGFNMYGQLGTGNTTNRPLPAVLAGF